MTDSPPASSSPFGFATGFLVGQLVLAAILFAFVHFFIFGEAPPADARAAARLASRRRRHRRQPPPDITPHSSTPLPSVHPPESLAWFNELAAQTLAHVRADALADHGLALRSSLTARLNASRPPFLAPIRVTDFHLGAAAPVFRRARVEALDEHDHEHDRATATAGHQRQARVDVEWTDVATLAVDTRLVLHYPRPDVAALPVALSVSIERLRGTLTWGVSSSSSSSSTTPPGVAFTLAFRDDHRLDLAVHSLIGARSRLQDVPKIARLVEDRIHRWFDDRCVGPHGGYRIVLPSLLRAGNPTAGLSPSPSLSLATHESASPDYRHTHDDDGGGSGGEIDDDDIPVTTEQRTRDWAARHGAPHAASTTTQLERAGEEMRLADEREKRRREREKGVEGLRRRTAEK